VPHAERASAECRGQSHCACTNDTIRTKLGGRNYNKMEGRRQGWLIGVRDVRASDPCFTFRLRRLLPERRPTLLHGRFPIRPDNALPRSFHHAPLSLSPSRVFDKIDHGSTLHGQTQVAPLPAQAMPHTVHDIRFAHTQMYRSFPTPVECFRNRKGCISPARRSACRVAYAQHRRKNRPSQYWIDMHGMQMSNAPTPECMPLNRTPNNAYRALARKRVDRSKTFH
jgi:hypothetical protein